MHITSNQKIMFNQNVTSDINLVLGIKNFPTYMRENSSKLEYYATVEIFDGISQNYEVVGQTNRESNPTCTFSDKIPINYTFGKLQILRVTFLDYKTLEKLGVVKTELSKLLKAPLKLEVTTPHNSPLFNEEKVKSSAVLFHENNISLPESVQIKVKVLELRLKKSLEFKTHYRFKLYRSEPKRWHYLCKSPELSRKGLSWEINLFSSAFESKKDKSNNILIVLLHKDKPIGDAIFKLTKRQLLKNMTVPLLIGKKPGVQKNRKNLPSTGILWFEDCSRRRRFNLVSYLEGGQNFTPIYAVDFTAYGNDVVKSIHESHSEGPYFSSIKALEKTLSAYEVRGRSLLWGFGARAGNKESDCFSLTFDRNNPYCEGIESIRKHLQDSVNKTLPAKTKKVSHVIEEVKRFSDHSGEDNYVIAVILTNAKNFDVKETMSQILALSKKPISFIFVEMGSGDFSRLEERFDDVDWAALKRRNTHFVSYNQIERAVGESKFNEFFSEKCLEKINKQFLGHKKNMSIAPLRPKPHISSALLNETINKLRPIQPAKIHVKQAQFSPNLCTNVLFKPLQNEVLFTQNAHLFPALRNSESLLSLEFPRGDSNKRDILTGHLQKMSTVSELNENEGCFDVEDVARKMKRREDEELAKEISDRFLNTLEIGNFQETFEVNESQLVAVKGDLGRNAKAEVVKNCDKPKAVVKSGREQSTREEQTENIIREVQLLEVKENKAREREFVKVC